VVDNAKAIRWLKTGAQPTDTVAKILTNSGAIAEWKAGGTGEPAATDAAPDEPAK
jgi:ribosomal protein S16